MIDENGKLVEGQKYITSIDPLTGRMTYGTNTDQTVYQFVLREPAKPPVEAKLTVQYLTKDADGNDVALAPESKMVDVTYNASDATDNPDGTVAVPYGSLISTELAPLLLDAVEKDEKWYSLTTEIKIDTPIILATQEDVLTGTIKLYYDEMMVDAKLIVSYKDSAGNVLKADAGTDIKINLNNIDYDKWEVAFGELKDVANTNATIESLLLSSITDSNNKSYNLSNKPMATSIYKINFVTDDETMIITIPLIYNTTGGGTNPPVNPPVDPDNPPVVDPDNPPVDPDNPPDVPPGGGGSIDYEGGDTEPGGTGGGGDTTTPTTPTTPEATIPDNPTPLAPYAPIQTDITEPENEVIAPAEEITIEDEDVPLGQGPETPSDNPKTGADAAKGLGAIALLLAAGALGIELKRKNA